MNNESWASGVDLQVKYIYMYIFDVQETNDQKKSQPLQTPLLTNYQQVFKTYLYTFILSTTL